MIPNFALALSFESISLLRRSGPRWARIDEVPIDHDDLDARVVAMRDRAEALDPDGAQVAVVIPNEQIRYLDLRDEGGSDAERKATILDALEGTTPYPVADLVHDHALTRGRLQVAAVARDTLNEAEDFARDHGFVPVCHVAQAEDGAFDGAVYFGPASDWTRTVFRPGRAIAVVPADEKALQPRAPEPEPAPPVQPVPLADATPPAKAATPPAPEAPQATETPAPETPETPDPTKEAKPEQAPLPPASLPLAATYEPHLIASLPPLTPPESQPEEAPADLEAARLKPLPPAARPNGFGPAASEPPAAAETPAQPTAAPVETPTTAPDVDAPIRPRFTPVFTKRDMARDAGITSDHIEDLPGTEVEADDVPVVFTHARPDAMETAPEDAAPTPAAKPQPVKETPPRAPRLGAARGPATPEGPAAPVAAPEAQPKGGKARPLDGKALKAMRGGRGPGLLRPKAPVPGDGAPAKAPTARTDTRPALSANKDTDAPAAAPAPSANPLARLAALRAQATQETGPSEDTTGVQPRMPAFANTGTAVPASPPAADRFEPSDERERMTVFGARAQDQAQIGGKPRFLGLMLSSGLLLFLAGIAAWASVFRDDGIAGFFRSDLPTTSIAALPGVDEGPALPAQNGADAPAVPDITIDIDPDAAPPDEEPREIAALETDAPVVDAPEAPALSQPAVPRALTSQEAATTYAATGIWQRAPGAPLTPPTDGVDGIYVASIDPDIRIFDAVALPDLPGTVAEPVLADPGLPPPAGVTFDIDERGVVRATPEGAMTPDGMRVYAGLPPVVPPFRNPANAPDAPQAAPEATGPDATAPVETSPLAAVRPEARPTDIVEQRERATLQGISLDELQDFRPQARPRTAQEDAAVDEPDATEQAVRASLVPVTRPRSMAAIVRRAEEARPTEPVQTASAAAIAPPTVQPTVPSSVNVARAATVRNAISLNQVSLIGVYGTPSNRRALVRLASGRYVKVQVGDRLDGGRVAAISEGALSYTKRGRNVTLEMPRG